MSIDLVTYCQDSEKLCAELSERGFVSEDGGVYFPLNNRTPTQNNNRPETVTLIRCTTNNEVELLKSFNSIEVLGTKEEVDADPEKTAKYESAYSREPYTVKDSETGEEYTVTPPKWHGDFA